MVVSSDSPRTTPERFLSVKAEAAKTTASTATAAAAKVNFRRRMRFALSSPPESPAPPARRPPKGLQPEPPTAASVLSAPGASGVKSGSSPAVSYQSSAAPPDALRDLKKSKMLTARPPES